MLWEEPLRIIMSLRIGENNEKDPHHTVDIIVIIIITTFMHAYII